MRRNKGANLTFAMCSILNAIGRRRIMVEKESQVEEKLNSVSIKNEK